MVQIHILRIIRTFFPYKTEKLFHNSSRLAARKTCHFVHNQVLTTRHSNLTWPKNLETTSMETAWLLATSTYVVLHTTWAKVLWKNCVNEETPVNKYHKKIKHRLKLAKMMCILLSLNWGYVFEVLFVSLFLRLNHQFCNCWNFHIIQCVFHKSTHFSAFFFKTFQHNLIFISAAL